MEPVREARRQRQGERYQIGRGNARYLSRYLYRKTGGARQPRQTHLKHELDASVERRGAQHLLFPCHTFCASTHLGQLAP
jgi:hypothetical protein